MDTEKNAYSISNKTSFCLRLFGKQAFLVALLATPLFMSGCSGSPKTDIKSIAAPKQTAVPETPVDSPNDTAIPDVPPSVSPPIQPTASISPASSPEANNVGVYLASRFAQSRYDWAGAVAMLEPIAEDAVGGIINLPVVDANGGIATATNGELPAVSEEQLVLARRTFLLALGAGEWDKAKRLAWFLARYNPDFAFADVFLAADDIRLGDTKGRYWSAEQRLLNLPADSLSTYARPLLLSWALAGENRADEAIAALEPLKYESGFDILYLVQSMLIWEYAGAPDVGLAPLTEHLEQSVPPERTVQILGTFLERNNKTAEARRLYIDYLKTQPNSVFAGLGLKRIRGNTALNVKSSRPTPATASSGALYDLAEALASGGVDEPALLYAQLARYLDPEAGEPHFLAARILAARGRTDVAERYIRSILENPDLKKQEVYWQAYGGLADILAMQDKYPEAIALLQKILPEAPEAGQILAHIGDLYRRQEQFVPATNAYQKAIDALEPLQENHWPLVYALGITLERQNRWEEAETVLLRALKLEPDQPDVLNYLAYTWADRGVNLGRAKRMLMLAAAQRPNDAQIIDSLGWVLYRLQNFTDSAAILERAVELMPDDPTINDHLGDAYAQVGRNREAIFQWQRSLAALETEQKQSEATTIAPITEATTAPVSVATLKNKIQNGLPKLPERKSTTPILKHVTEPAATSPTPTVEEGTKPLPLIPKKPLPTN